MDPDDWQRFRELSHQALDDMIDHLATIEDRPVWQPAPAAVRARFEHSPGRRDATFLGNQSAFDAAFVIEGRIGTAVVGVETEYHEHTKAEPPPKSV